MKKTYTPTQIEQIICRSKMSRHAFCREVGINWGDFWKIMHGKKPISDKLNQRIDDFLKSQEKSFFEKVMRFFKGA